MLSANTPWNSVPGSTATTSGMPKMRAHARTKACNAASADFPVPICPTNGKEAPDKGIQPNMKGSFTWNLPFDEIETNGVIHAIRLRGSSGAPSIGSFIRIALAALEIIQHPARDFWLRIASPKKARKVPIARMARIVVGELQVCQLLISRSPVNFGRNVIITIRLCTWIISRKLFRPIFFGISFHGKTETGIVH